MPADQGFRKRHAAELHASSVSKNDGGRNHLSLLTQKVAAKHFEVYWQRGVNGAPARWSKGVEKCWKLGVAAAIAATQKELRNVCSQPPPSDESLLTYMREKAVREHGQVINGHKFKRPPSVAILAHYAALGEVWQERYGPHYQAGTVPDDIKELLSAPVAVATVPAASSLRPSPQPCLEDKKDQALLQKRPRTESTDSRASSKGVLSSVSGEALTAWGTPTDTDADSSAQATYLHCDGPFDEACTLPATTGAASSSYCDMQQWPFASEQRSTANLDLALHAALADPHSEALAAPEQAAYPGCLDSLSRACSARAPLRAIPTHVAVQQACAGHHLLRQRLAKLEAELMEAIQQHRANSAEFARRLARLERNMGSPGRTKLEESCFDIFNASSIFEDLYRD